VVVIGGEAGVGKTRLVEQLAATARERGVRVLGGGCVPLGEEGLPFAPVIEALRGLADDLDADELQAVAGPGEILVSKSVRDLVVGSEIMLEDRGTHPLKGVQGSWQLFAVVNR
jgi:predicted ATPase